MITKQQLIEKCEGLYFKPVDEAEWNLCVDKCKEIGITAFVTFKKQNSLSFAIDDDGDFCRSLLNRSIPATKFLSYFSNVDEWVEEEKMNIEEKDGDYTIQLKERTEEPEKQKTKREYLLNLVARMKDNKKEFIDTIDKRIEKIHEQLACDRLCFISDEGEYIIDQISESNKIKKVAEFINRMEADFE